MAAKKCAHDICTCMAKEGSKYCSQQCEDSKNMMTLQCDCGHKDCGAVL